MKTEILGFYDGFVGKVAKGRKMTEEEVRKIGEGHVYSGTRGKEIGLVDEIGGLEAAIHAARDAAGIPKDEKIEIVELPTMPDFQSERSRQDPVAVRNGALVVRRAG